MYVFLQLPHSLNSSPPHHLTSSPHPFSPHPSPPNPPFLTSSPPHFLIPPLLTPSLTPKPSIPHHLTTSLPHPTPSHPIPHPQTLHSSPPHSLTSHSLSANSLSPHLLTSSLQPSAEEEKLFAKLEAVETKLTLAEQEKLRIQKVYIAFLYSYSLACLVTYCSAEMLKNLVPLYAWLCGTMSKSVYPSSLSMLG